MINDYLKILKFLQQIHNFSKRINLAINLALFSESNSNCSFCFLYEKKKPINNEKSPRDFQRI